MTDPTAVTDAEEISVLRRRVKLQTRALSGLHAQVDMLRAELVTVERSRGAESLAAPVAGPTAKGGIVHHVECGVIQLPNGARYVPEARAKAAEEQLDVALGSVTRFLSDGKRIREELRIESPTNISDAVADLRSRAEKAETKLKAIEADEREFVQRHAQEQAENERLRSELSVAQARVEYVTGRFEALHEGEKQLLVGGTVECLRCGLEWAMDDEERHVADCLVAPLTAASDAKAVPGGPVYCDAHGGTARWYDCRTCCAIASGAKEGA